MVVGGRRSGGCRSRALEWWRSCVYDGRRERWNIAVALTVVHDHDARRMRRLLGKVGSFSLSSLFSVGVRVFPRVYILDIDLS